MVIAVELMEGRVRQPGFVEVQGVDPSVEHAFDVFDVIQNAVVKVLCVMVSMRGCPLTWLAKGWAAIFF